MIKKPVKSSKPVTSKSSSLADLYDAADASETSNFLSEGQHEVRLNSFTLEEKPTGAIATMTVEAIDGDEEGKKANSRYKLTDADGNVALGMNYFKRDLALLGYENVPGKKIKKTLEEITEAQPMVIVNVKVKDGYTNVFLQGVAEDAEPEDLDTEEEAEEETEEEDVEVGSQVEFTDPDDEDEKLQGEVVSIKGETATVLVGKKKYKVEGGDLTIVVPEDDEAVSEEEEATAEIEVGSRVKWTNKEDDEVEGKVIKIVDDVATIKDDDGDKHKVDVDALELVGED